MNTEAIYIPYLVKRDLTTLAERMGLNGPDEVALVFLKERIDKCEGIPELRAMLSKAKKQAISEWEQQFPPETTK